MKVHSKAARLILLEGLAFSLMFLWHLAPARGQEADASEPSQASQDNPASPAQPSPDLPDTQHDDTGLIPDTSYGGQLGPNYKIGPEDVLTIDVFNVAELKNIMARVANDGTITVPLLGQVKAAGFTAEQLRQELAQKWGETYLQDPQVTIFVRQFRSKPVSVIGAVDKPGLYPLTGRRRLIDALSMAGGLGKRNTAPAGATVYVTRKEGFTDFSPVDGMRLVAPDQVEIDLRDLLYSHNEALNIEVRPFDIISVSKADVVYVLGAVKKAGGFLLENRERVTVMQALAMAEGLDNSPAKHAALIIRRSPDGSKREIPVNIGKILKGKAEDMQLAANDILYVPNSRGIVAAKKGAEAAIGTITGIIIWGRY